MQEIIQASLRDNIKVAIGDFLYDEGFALDENTKWGILELINLISDYHEEGNALFPQILVTNNLDFFKSIPNKEIVISDAVLSVDQFKTAIKLCAPLALNSWIIFIEVKNNRIKYGVISAEISEISPSIYNQTVGELRIEYAGATIAFIRNIGQKKVELSGLKKRLIVSLTLDEPKEISSTELQTLCKCISSKCHPNRRNIVKTFFEKIIDDALKTGHGNLIGVVNDRNDSISALKTKVVGDGGIYLPLPIDFQSLIIEAEENKNKEFALNLKTHASVLKSMLNHDGITIISNKGRVIGYHILIGDILKKKDIVHGGARSKAFKSMENCGKFAMCFYKSQDGQIKLWKKK